MKFLICVLLCIQIQHYNCARILGIIPTPAYSHQQVFHPIWKALAKRGHELLVITSDPLNDPNLPNLKEIDIRFSYKTKDTLMKSLIKDKEFGLEMFKTFAYFGETLVTHQLEHKVMQDFLHNDSLDFDLVMFEHLSPVFGAFAYKYNCPSIGLLTLEIGTDGNEILGNPQHPSVAPHLAMPAYKNLNYVERLQSSLLYIAWPLINKYMFEAVADRIIKKFFGEEYPSAHEIVKNVDMVFANTNQMLKLPLPMAPNVLEFGGGVHIREPKPLPNDIEKFINSSKTGVVYFSLGSNVKSDFVSDDLKKVIVETLTFLPYDVLWKFEEELIKDNSKIKIVKWAPQQDILRHPNVKAFVTQGGIQSLEEALYAHVPVVVLPFFGDQQRNARMVEQLGIGKSFNYDYLKTIEFKEAIMEVATETKYKTKMMELAKLSKDKPMDGIDSVVWWTEYVIRNKGAKHLRSLLVDLPWYQYYLLDVIGTVVLAFAVIIFIIYKICKLLCYCCGCNKNKKVKTQ